MKVEFRQATADDVRAFYGDKPMFSMRGYVAVKGGEVVGVGGIYYESGRAMAFSEMKPPMRESKRDLVKATRLLMKFIDGLGVPVYAVANQGEPTAPDLLSRLGFVPTGLQAHVGEVLRRG